VEQDHHTKLTIQSHQLDSLRRQCYITILGKSLSLIANKNLVDDLTGKKLSGAYMIIKC